MVPDHKSGRGQWAWCWAWLVAMICCFGRGGLAMICAKVGVVGGHDLCDSGRGGMP